MMYLYETHCHEAMVSKCATATPKQLVDVYRSNGYSGAIITDHFLNGNNVLKKDAIKNINMFVSWEEKIETMFSGYEQAKAYGDKMGFTVMFGFEYTNVVSHADFLVYGVSKQWLLENPDLLEWDFVDFANRVHEAGGIIVHAHPFREASKFIQLSPRQCDGVEIYNAANWQEEYNDRAKAYAKSYGLKPLSGSDFHHISQKEFGGICTDFPIGSIEEFVVTIKSGNYHTIEHFKG